ncbi:MAG: dihydrodipicolinate reductase [Candidatus Margulisiibacteriota bacterium]|nr:MAG: dihydrodipicolinate reductase [Candidatus Margulisbacteria bacterium GWD2_39_127]OGI05315.1 MAG: dihydrodipicolinate reductase [Candidatus Margulisbacteria bacterium GWF2_38_17]OGI10826.1 MAG: dihydrodipicolinate reductase [Candidatus Margulisbacteria bacterium GWE2_39_32]PZM83511.1 MAG: dihydrodipicolinate reductase [Candidatus Margulisiibacteriota bacterium]HAR64312.1 dihydrodipicolinate reductase [Candidatus Margulisiibacteriota bacterium]
MKKLTVGVFGFGKTGRLVAGEFLKSDEFHLSWVIRESRTDNHKYASRLLGFEFDRGEIYSIDDITEDFYVKNHTDLIIDFSSSTGIYSYAPAAYQGTRIVSAISKYEQQDLDLLKSLSSQTPVLYSPNITLGVNVLLIAGQILQKIAPHADIEIVEEHFREKKEVSGTAKKIAKALNLSEQEHINSIRVGGIVGRHEIIFGLPNQTMRLVHESFNRAVFGQGAIFASKWLVNQPAGLYSMENIIAEMFKQNIPVY